jgi:hypothetical protein
MFRALMSRRAFLADGGMNLGVLGVAVALAQAGELSAAGATDPLTPKAPHFPPRARRFVHLFLEGGPSHLDLLDPKPQLKRRDGQIHAGWQGILFGSPFKFSRRGRSGIEMSELLPGLGAHADNLTVLRSLHTDIPAHGQGTRMMMSGHSTLTRPNYGAWLTYGLGTENANLPAFIALGASPSDATIGSGFLPPVYQGTGIPLRPGQDPIPYVRNLRLAPPAQRGQLDLLNDLNREFGELAPNESSLEARMRSFELAFRMQSAAPEAFNLQTESEATRERYGDTDWGRRLLTARRLLERGVRVLRVQAGRWDHHNNLVPRLRADTSTFDQAASAFLTDLKRTGLLEDTLILMTGEFGRTPVRQAGSDGESVGRDHNHRGFSAILAGGGIKRGHVHGATDDLGREAVLDRVHVHDLHATILHLMGFDHERLLYRHAGRDYRLTDVHGNVVRGVIA